MMIQKRRIPSVDLSLSLLGLGCAPFGGEGWGGQDDGLSAEAMQICSDAGITHFDTAAHYGQGHSETVVGGFIKDKRNALTIATKAFPLETTSEYILQQVDASRDRIGIDVIDIFYIHWPRAGHDMRPVMEGLEKAREQGKVRAIGVSNFSVEQMTQVAEVGRIDVHQTCYNLLWRFPEAELFPYCIQNEIALVTYSSLALGILTGKFPISPEFLGDDFRANTVFFLPEVWPQLYVAVQEMVKVADRVRLPLAHIAMQWLAGQPGVTSILVGARNAQQAADNIVAFDSDIPKDAMEEVEQISDETWRRLPQVENIFQFYP